MGLLDLEAGDGEARPRIPPRPSHEIPHATRDGGREGPGGRPAGELRQGGNRDPRATLVPRRELQFARRDGIARVHRMDRESPRESRPPRSLEGEGREARRTLGLRRGLRRNRCAKRNGVMFIRLGNRPPNDGGNYIRSLRGAAFHEVPLLLHGHSSAKPDTISRLLHEGVRDAGREPGDDAARRQVRPTRGGGFPPAARTELVSSGITILLSLSKGRGDRPPGLRRGRRGEGVPRTTPQGSEARGAARKGGRHRSLRQGSGRDLDRATLLIERLTLRHESARPPKTSDALSRCPIDAGTHSAHRPSDRPAGPNRSVSSPATRSMAVLPRFFVGGPGTGPIFVPRMRSYRMVPEPQC